MALLDNTGFSSVFADVMDDEIAFDNTFGAEEDDELMEFVLSNKDGVVVEPTFEEAEVDASNVEDETPDKGAVEGLAGPEINAKEIETEKCKKEAADVLAEFEENFITDKIDKMEDEAMREQSIDNAYANALDRHLREENDSDIEEPNTSKEGPETMCDPGDSMD